MRAIDGKTVVCGSIAGKPSPLGAAIHNAGYEALKLNFVYIPFQCFDVRAAVNAMRGLGIRGLGVATPFKPQVIPFLDEMDNTARKIGAVNTIVNEGSRLKGYNTDYLGALDALREETELRGKRVVLVGAGSAARAIAYGLKGAGAVVHVYNRTPERAIKVAEDFLLEAAADLRDVSLMKDFDVLVNAATPPEGGSIIPDSILSKGKVVMDVLAADTALCRQARKRGCRVVTGYRMLLHQAKYQFEKYTGKPAPLKAMERALAKAGGK